MRKILCPDTGKVIFWKQKEAEEAKNSMERRHGLRFTFYACIQCSFYHVGKKRSRRGKHMKI